LAPGLGETASSEEISEFGNGEPIAEDKRWLRNQSRLMN